MLWPKLTLTLMTGNGYRRSILGDALPNREPTLRGVHTIGQLFDNFMALIPLLNCFAIFCGVLSPGKQKYKRYNMLTLLKRTQQFKLKISLNFRVYLYNEYTHVNINVDVLNFSHKYTLRADCCVPVLI